MSITKKSGRQEVIAARVTGTFGTGTDIGVEGTYEAIDVPAGAIVVSGHLYISDPTTATVDVHVQSAALAVYLADADGAAAGLSPLVPTGYKYLAPDTIDIMVDTADPAAAGIWELVVEYVVEDRAAFSQG